MTDGSIRQHITDLVEQEHALRDRLGRGEITGTDEHEQLQAIEVELDQCWDLLRQRQAKREFGEDPETAQVRPASTVENYLG
jgi:hypothetical protein